ncbi:nucleotidyltransferase domain-containing protein [Sabulibacter ruber]|uniref:nucleotidyltransferase domain-containing protein n=1 Tax=Sabulibacter ruber TaxID=2811901 RepID=UPI001A95BB13|nr:nucleotidyltransferase domain-containing protein [Sabulibacter ruber]
MRNEILQKLLELERTHQITILFAVESGSRAWGFPSPDSDYDVRFVYTHQPDWYLTLEEQKDTLEWLEGDLDFVGWELRKALRLMRKSNASVFEKMQSPILYLKRGSFLEKMQETAPAYFSARAGLHHYLSMAYNYYNSCAPEPEVKLKSYFYLLRTALASLWIVENKSIPPLLFQDLLPLVKDQTMREEIQQLLQVKTKVDESYRHPKQETLETFVMGLLQYCEAKAGSLPKAQGSTTALNQLLRNTILDYDTQPPQLVF